MLISVPGGTFNTVLASVVRSSGLNHLPCAGFDVRLRDGSSLVGELDMPSSPALANLLLVHGLGSSCREPAVRRQGLHLAREGFQVYRLNHRNVGSGAGKATGIYHAGRGPDLVEAIEALSRKSGNRLPWIIVGQSLSGNMVLKIAGQSDSAPHLRALDVRGCVALSPIVDLEGGSASMSSPLFGLLEKSVLQRLRQYLDGVPNLKQSLRDAAQCAKTVSELDERVVAPYLGFRDRFEYYRQYSAFSELDTLQVPCHVIFSSDDPIAGNTLSYLSQGSRSRLVLDIQKHGGHLGFMKICTTRKGLVAYGDQKVAAACRALLNGFVGV